MRMNRVDYYRQLRQRRRRCLISIVLFIMFVFAGIYAADYSTKKLMGDSVTASLFGVYNYENYVELELMNRKVYINKSHIQNDLKSLREKAQIFVNK